MIDMQAANGTFGNDSGSAVQTLQDKASEMAGEVSDTAREYAAQIRDSAGELGEAAMEKVDGVVGDQRSAGADYIASIAKAADKAADAFDNDLPQAANFIRQASEHIRGAADMVRDGDAREAVNRMREFAQTQPTLFFGGALLLGFAAVRFLKSSPPSSYGSAGRENGHGTF